MRLDQASELVKVREELVESRRSEDTIKSQLQSERRKMEQRIEQMSAESRLKESEWIAQISSKEAQLREASKSREEAALSAAALKEFADLKSEIARLSSSLN